APGIYKRGSMAPVYQLTPQGEQRRFVDGGVALTDIDFQSNAAGITTATQKMDELTTQLTSERGTAAPPIMPTGDRTRSNKIPFRGNPSDVDIISINGQRKAYVPLGGDLMTPGNEVAAVDLQTNTVIRRIKVGIRPQRIAVHPAGLIFVCNQYSNYITVIDPATDQPLVGPNGVIEIKTEFYCTDLAFVPRSIAGADDDEQDLYVANGWRGSVLKYSLKVERSALADTITDLKLVTPANPVPESQPTAEILGAGANPYRLNVSRDKRSLYVANFRGGEVARIDLATATVAKRVAFNGPVPDVVPADGVLLIPTTTIDRGLPFINDPKLLQIDAPPFMATGIDGQQHQAHPGAMYDNTKATNFEDLRNGLLTADLQLNSVQNAKYFTDDISSEVQFQPQQKVLQGALAQTVITDKAGKRAWLANSGSDNIQEIAIRGGQFPVSDVAAQPFATAARPFALAIDEARTEIYSAAWGGDVLEIFNFNNGTLIATIDLGYANLANAKYPATNIEKGEFLFYNTAWSNNGRKSCAGCHYDELSVDGVGYANGATAPTEYHKVPANWNLQTTDAYFWSGTFESGTYAALAADFQTRSNCELIAFGFAEGLNSVPAQRIGDPANKVVTANDLQCRPITTPGKVLANNFDDITRVIGESRVIRDQVVQQATVAIGTLDFITATRFTDFYSVSEIRIPPNPLAYLAKAQELDAATAAKITTGKQVFADAGCGNCHNGSNARSPFTDGLNHGAGVNWAQKFVDRYSNDPRLLAIIPAGIPQAMIDALSPVPTPDREINVHVDPIDYFIPGCFAPDACLVFEDPLLAARNSQAETDRLEAIVTVNLANADRGFVPGNVRGSPLVNTPSLRAIWYQGNYLRHGLAHSLKEAVLAPGHPLLDAAAGEKGFAIDSLGNKDVHGVTAAMDKATFDALELYVESIE
ncbi:MAG: hypothetical protein H7138_21595, partial [Myxococcales bacterium]|nr:hypothetical protein [Myxococcales bacterium]